MARMRPWQATLRLRLPPRLGGRKDGGWQSIVVVVTVIFFFIVVCIRAAMVVDFCFWIKFQIFMNF